MDLGCWRLSVPISFPAQIWKLKHLRHLYAPGPIMLRGHYSEPDVVMWNLQSMIAIVFDKQTSSLINKGTFPNLKKLGLQISQGCKDKWPKLLQSLQELSNLSKLRISFKRKLFEGSMSRDYVRVAFPPNVRKLTLTGISCMTDEGINALGNHTKLQILRLTGGIRMNSFDLYFGSHSFDLNCVAGGFPQLQVFQMTCLRVENWKLGNGAMLCLRSLIIDNCDMLNDLPLELWSLP
ncbi:hypothetical protein Fmac_022396 [Flemingia macrophylla]|uniref:Uncharacterized protein n=1 Tax=Flemingia macrophylla TaxID=520843 RepID=A0ABD1LZK7_9FABA